MTVIHSEHSAITPSLLTPSEDDLLLLRMRDDDQDAYRCLVERHIDRAYALALRLLKNQSDAEDVAQDVFVKTWLHRKNWQPGRAQFSTWLYRVVVNRCIDLQRRPTNDWIEDVDEPADQGEDSVTTIHRQQVHGKLQQAMDRLPDQQRAAMVLSYYEDMSNAEIADIMDTTVAAVESLLKRGRQKMRDLMKRSENDVRTYLGRE